MAAKSSAGRSIFLGTFIHSKSLEELEFLHDTAVFVDEKGTIVAIEQGCDEIKAEEAVFPKLGWTKGEATVKVAKAGHFFFPGFIGASFHFLSHKLSLTVEY
jgi:guanine deaminase